MRWEGSVFPKGRKWWVKHKPLGSQAWTNSPSDFYLDDPEGKAKAQAFLAHLRELWEAHERAAGPGGGPLTVKAYAERWLAKRRGLGIDSAREEGQRLRDHVYPSIGEMPLQDVRRLHVRALMEAVKAKPKKSRKEEAKPERLAPRTILHVYRTLRHVFTGAVRDELLEANPVDLEPRELPKKEDRDPEWRATAVFTAAEVELLLSHPVVPEDRRVLYAIEFLTGSRPGEAAAVRWDRYERDHKPLGKLILSRAYSTPNKAVKATKTKHTRQVPVHPTLAKLLATWKLSGFAAYTGKKPEPGDLIVPAARGGHRNVGYSLNMMHRDLDQLGLRKRRHYDSRRTFRSLAGDHGADRNVIHWLTHATKDILDDYYSPSWQARCDAVLAIPVRLRQHGTIARIR